MPCFLPSSVIGSGSNLADRVVLSQASVDLVLICTQSAQLALTASIQLSSHRQARVDDEIFTCMPKPCASLCKASSVTSWCSTSTEYDFLLGEIFGHAAHSARNFPAKLNFQIATQGTPCTYMRAC